MRTSPLRSVLALCLTVSTAMTLVVAPAFAEDPASFGGRIFDSDGVTPRDGVTVTLVDTETHQVFRSKPSGSEGAFRIEAAPPGSYRMLAETGEGAFLAAEAVRLEPGRNRALALSLNASAEDPAGGSGTSAPADGMPLWAEIVVAGSIALGALLVIDELSSEVEQPASTF